MRDLSDEAKSDNGYYHLPMWGRLTKEVCSKVNFGDWFFFAFRHVNIYNS